MDCMNEKELLIQLKNGDEKAFTLLYNYYWQLVYNFCRLYVSSKHEIEEIIQKVFIKLWEHRILICEEDNFKGLLFIITRNLV